jgi:hypothetical protein
MTLVVRRLLIRVSSCTYVRTYAGDRVQYTYIYTELKEVRTSGHRLRGRGFGARDVNVRLTDRNRGDLSRLPNEISYLH